MHTTEEPGEYKPWWLVDLGGQSYVEDIIVTNSGETQSKNLYFIPRNYNRFDYIFP